MNEDFFEKARQVLRRNLADGQLLESGWQAFRKLNISDQRMIFLAGVKFGIDAIMFFTDDTEGVSENDMRRMESMMKELNRFEEELRKAVGG